MAQPSYDCLVIGSGPGGYVAAIRAAQLGMNTAVVEKDRVGGRCLNYACIPAKAMLRVADVLSEVREAGDFGIKVAEPEVDFAAVGKRRERVISTLTGGVGGLFKKNGIEVIEGEASLAGAGNVSVDGQTYALASFQDEPALAVVFLANHCPYVGAWEDRILQLAREYAARAAFIAIRCRVHATPKCAGSASPPAARPLVSSAIRVAQSSTPARRISSSGPPRGKACRPGASRC